MHGAIVGGSLAGACLAYLLESSGHSISVFDPRAPWEKPCGGGLYTDALRRHPILRQACTWNYPVRWRWISSVGIGTRAVGADVPDLWRRLDAFLQAQGPLGVRVTGIVCGGLCGLAYLLMRRYPANPVTARDYHA